MPPTLARSERQKFESTVLCVMYTPLVWYGNNTNIRSDRSMAMHTAQQIEQQLKRI